MLLDRVIPVFDCERIVDTDFDIEPIVMVGESDSETVFVADAATVNVTVVVRLLVFLCVCDRPCDGVAEIVHLFDGLFEEDLVLTDVWPVGVFEAVEVPETVFGYDNVRCDPLSEGLMVIDCSLDHERCDSVGVTEFEASLVAERLFVASLDDDLVVLLETVKVAPVPLRLSVLTLEPDTELVTLEDSDMLRSGVGELLRVGVGGGVIVSVAVIERVELPSCDSEPRVTDRLDV